MMAIDTDTKISILSMRDTGPAPEAALARDIVKRGLIASPILGNQDGAYNLNLIPWSRPLITHINLKGV